MVLNQSKAKIGRSASILKKELLKGIKSELDDG